MIRTGICGALNKSISQADLVCSVKKVADGEVLFSHEQFIQARLWSESVVQKWETLTKRERQILKSLESGVGNKIIAQEYVISQKTVAFHVSNILQKLNVRSRQEAALWVNKNINQ